jgi:RNA polymerase sigma-70 factor (sigma-E family)
MWSLTVKEHDVLDRGVVADEVTNDHMGATDSPRGRPEFEVFVAARSHRLLRAGYLLTRDWGSAEDLVQTALAKVWRQWSRVEDPDAYVWQAMTRTYQTWWRRKWRGEIATGQLPDSPAAGVDADERTDLWAAMSQLSRQQRAVIVLRYFVDLSENDTAEVLGCSVGTVKTHARRALARLRVEPSLQRVVENERELR